MTPLEVSGVDGSGADGSGSVSTASGFSVAVESEPPFWDSQPAWQSLGMPVEDPRNQSRLPKQHDGRTGQPLAHGALTHGSQEGGQQIGAGRHSQA
jgi:hypothetical protein